MLNLLIKHSIIIKYLNSWKKTDNLE